MRKFEVFLCEMTLFCLLGVSLLPDALAGDPLTVTVSILPQKYFVEKIAGNRLDVSVMVLPGASPATYEPRPQQMLKLTKSKIYFAVGVPFETVWLRKFENLNPRIKIVSTQAGIEKVPMEAHVHGNDEEAAEHKGAIHAEIKDPHIWLAPPLVILQARNILYGLLQIDPEYRETYEANYKRFVRELVDLDIRFIRQFKGSAQNKRFMVYHPAWGYFARAYGLKQIPIELEGKSPTPRELQELIDMARKIGIKVIFVQPQFSTKSADTIARAIGGKVTVADPLAVNWAENLEKVAASFETVLK